jgi:TPR repeat protein
MKFPAAATLLSLIACASFAAEVEEPSAAEAPFADLVLGLSSESFREREDATRALWEQGDAALEILRAASASKDPETAKRAAGVLEKVELRITPETAPEILDHIRRYRTAPQNLKANHINELRRRKAYFQLLKLYSMEEKPQAKADLAESIRGVAMQGAREAIAVDDYATAERFLRMSAKEPNDLIALAWVYRSMGKLGEGMEDPPAPEGVATEDWKITLLRVRGDLTGAIREAVEGRQARLFAGLKVLEGDPTLWIRQNGKGDRGVQALDSYVQIALKRWEGKDVKDGDFAPLLEILKERDSDDLERALASLAALGRLGEAEKHLAKEQPELGFQHYISQERIGEALETLGLDPDEPDYTEWAAERFAKLMREEDDDGSPLMELLVIAGFLETRGLSKELDEAYTGPLGKYAKEYPEGLLDFMRALFQPGTGAPRFAAAFAAAWAGDDDNRWGEMFSVAFGEEDEVGEWLGWIAEIEPGVSRPDTMRVMMALFGMGSDPDGLSEKWLEKAWKAAKESPEADRAKHLLRIRMLADAKQDVATALKVRDSFGPEDTDSRMWPSVDKFLSAAGRWKEAADIIEEGGSNLKSSPDFHAYMAATLRRAGMENRAAEHDAMAEKLSLGYSPSCARIGDLYVYGGDMKRAAEWYRRAAFHSDVSGNDFVAALDTYARSMFEEGRWDIAASCYEALALTYTTERFTGGSLSGYSKARLNADLAKALAILPEDRGRAIALLEGIHRNFMTDGVLADDFFPMLRKAGLKKEMEKWFGESWAKISGVIERFPECDNTRNTAAWLASRARMKVPEAEKHLKAALAKNPGQAAYLDTMAEVRFAMGDRAGAVKWSDLSLLRYPLTDSPYDTMIRKQNHRFHNDPLPK